MKPAQHPVQRHANARLLHIDASGTLSHRSRRELVTLLRAGDVVVANDAATLPASLPAMHERTGSKMELRLARRDTLEPGQMQRLAAIVFGAGDHRTRTEDRPLPPLLQVGDRLSIGDATATIEALEHPRFVQMRIDADAARVWRVLAQWGRPIQYAHLSEPLALWDVWTPYAANPVAYEPPSAGFALDWQTLEALRKRAVQFVTLTHAAGISSTGDLELDARLPLDEPYRIPDTTVAAVAAARESGRRVIAIGTTVVRALEHAASADGTVRAGSGIATQRIGPTTTLRVIDAIVSGTHEVGSSHYELLRAFQSDEVLLRASKALETERYLTHEFGDSMLVEAHGRGCLREIRPVAAMMCAEARKIPQPLPASLASTAA